MVLVDTSVWIDHLHTSEPQLVDLLNKQQVLIHPFVVGEMACGSLKNRSDILYFLQHLPQTPVATLSEVLYLLDAHRLMGRGLGFVDLHLLAATQLASPAQLWTRDKRLRAAANTIQLSLLQH